MRCRNARSTSSEDQLVSSGCDRFNNMFQHVVVQRMAPLPNALCKKFATLSKLFHIIIRNDINVARKWKLARTSTTKQQFWSYHKVFQPRRTHKILIRTPIEKQHSFHRFSVRHVSRKDANSSREMLQESNGHTNLPGKWDRSTLHLLSAKKPPNLVKTG